MSSIETCHKSVCSGKIQKIGTWHTEKGNYENTPPRMQNTYECDSLTHCL